MHKRLILLTILSFLVTPLYSFAEEPLVEVAARLQALAQSGSELVQVVRGEMDRTKKTTPELRTLEDFNLKCEEAARLAAWEASGAKEMIRFAPSFRLTDTQANVQATRFARAFVETILQYKAQKGRKRVAFRYGTVFQSTAKNLGWTSVLSDILLGEESMKTLLNKRGFRKWLSAQQMVQCLSPLLKRYWTVSLVISKQLLLDEISNLGHEALEVVESAKSVTVQDNHSLLGLEERIQSMVDAAEVETREVVAKTKKVIAPSLRGIIRNLHEQMSSFRVEEAKHPSLRADQLAKVGSHYIRYFSLPEMRLEAKTPSSALKRVTEMLGWSPEETNMLLQEKGILKQLGRLRGIKLTHERVVRILGPHFKRIVRR